MSKLLHINHLNNKYFNALRNEIYRLRTSEFVRNVSSMMKGTAVAQFVPVLISPILTRIFTPEDVGILTFFLSYSMIVSTIISGKYEMAIMLPKSDKDSVNLAALATMLIIIFSSLFIIFLIVFQNRFIHIMGADKISKWVIIVPITAGLIAYGNVLNYWVSRSKDFRSISKSKMIQTISSSGFNIGIGLFIPIPIILILGNLIGQALNSIYLTVAVIKKQISMLKEVRLPVMKEVGKKYIKFPLYDIPNSLSYSIATQGMNLVFARFFGDVVLGFYSQVQRILISPFGFISMAFTQVFFEKMADVYNNSRQEFNKYLKKAQNRLIVYFFFPFFAFVFLSKYIVPFVFGHEWKMMYQYIFVLSPMIFFTLTTSPYTYIFKILNKQEIALILNVLRMVMLIGVVIAGNSISGDPFVVFTLFSLTSILLTAVSIIVCLRYLKSKMSLIFQLQLITLVVLNLGFLYIIRYNIF